MYTVPPQYRGYADPNPSPLLANADELLDNVFVGAPRPKRMEKVLKKVNKTMNKIGKQDPGSGTDDSDFEYHHVEDDHEVKRAERGRKKKSKPVKKQESKEKTEQAAEDPKIASSSSSNKSVGGKKSSSGKKKSSSSRKFQSDPLMYVHDSLAADENDQTQKQAPQPPPHMDPYMVYPTQVPFGSHQTPYNYYAMQQEMHRQRLENYWRMQEYQPQSPRKEQKDKDFAYISFGDNAYYTSPEEYHRKQYEKMMGQNRQPGSWDGIIDPTQDQEFGFRKTYNPWFGAPMSHALGGALVYDTPQPDSHSHAPTQALTEISTQVETELSSGAESASGSSESHSVSESEVRPVSRRSRFPNLGAFIPPPTQDEKVSRFSARNIFGKRNVSNSRESLVSPTSASSQVSHDSNSSSYHPLPIPPSPGSYFSSTSFSLNEDPIRPQSSVSQRHVNYSEAKYAEPNVVAPPETTVSAAEEHSRALYNVWTGLTTTFKDWVNASNQPEKDDSFFSQVYQNAFGGSQVSNHVSENSSSVIPEETSDAPPSDDDDDDGFDARSMMEEGTVVEHGNGRSTPVLYEEDIENPNKKRLRKTMRFLLQKRGKNKDATIIIDGTTSVEKGVDPDNAPPPGAVLKFRRPSLISKKSTGDMRPGSSGSGAASLSGSAAGSALGSTASGTGTVVSAPPAEDAPILQKLLYQLALVEAFLQPYFHMLGALLRSHPIGATFLYPMDFAMAIHPRLKFVALALEFAAVLYVVYVVVNVVSTILAIVRIIFAPILWILGR